MDKLAGFVCRRCKKNSISVLWILFIIFSYSIAVQVMMGTLLNFFPKMNPRLGLLMIHGSHDGGIGMQKFLLIIKPLHMPV